MDSSFGSTHVTEKQNFIPYVSIIKKIGSWNWGEHKYDQCKEVGERGDLIFVTKKTVLQTIHSCQEIEAIDSKDRNN